MRISSSWLEQYVTVPEPEPLAHIFEMAGIGVEERDGESFTLEVTSNRGDWLSVIGLAREVAAMTQKNLRVPHSQLPEPAATQALSIEIEDVQDCSRYTGRLLGNVEVGPSPQWLQDRLLACGMRSVNNVVDITNFVMHEWGQPLHAFDAATLARVDGQITINVRRARAGESLRTLDEVERQLTTETLVIADANGPIALAGIMGGGATEVTSSTRTILLESAHFAPLRVRRGSRSLGLGTEASRRFERWVDPAGAVRAADKATEFLIKYANATLVSLPVDSCPNPLAPIEVTLRVTACNALLGLKLTTTAVTACLERLGFTVKPDEENVLKVTIPTFRNDINREVDLIEEVARIHGYDNIPISLPRTVNPMAGYTLSQRLEEKARGALLRCGLTEIITYSMENEAAVQMAGMPVEAAVLLRNPLSEDYTRLRTSLLPSLLGVLRKNNRLGARIFELGKVYLPIEGQEQPAERRRIGLALLDELSPRPHWQPRGQSVDFYGLKAVIETVLMELGAPRPQWRTAAEAPFHPGRCAILSIDGQDLGIAGELHPDIAARYDISLRAVLGQLDFDGITCHLSLLKPYRRLPRYPGIGRDLAFVLPASVLAADIEDSLRAAGGTLLRAVNTFDVYSGDSIAAGFKSLAVNLELRADDRTLTDTEADAVVTTLRSAIETQFNAQIRS